MKTETLDPLRNSPWTWGDFVQPESLRDSGVWIKRDFLPEAFRRRLLDDAEASQHELLPVERTGVGLVTDSDVRRSSSVSVDEGLARELDQMVVSLRGELPAGAIPEDAVHLPFQKILCYRPGDFFVPHSDERPVPFGPNRSLIGHRKAILIVGLSDPEDYDGGELELFGLVGSGHDNPFADCGIPIKVPAGAAVSYQADVVHGVRPVTRGSRYVASGSFGYVTEPDADNRVDE